MRALLDGHSGTRAMKVLAALTFVLLALAFVLGGCSQKAAEGGGEGEGAEEAVPANAGAEPEPEYSSWKVYVNGDDSYEAGGITYSIALNLTATNPTGDKAGAYTGSATAKTSTTGDVGGAQLNASAIAESSQLEFTLEDPTGDGALAPLTDDELTYTGKGTITMAAAGSGTVGGAGGAFGNTSSQQITVTVKGDAVTLTVPISGHTYTFQGTISGE